MRLYITRHGETEWNREGRSQGTLNSNLTEEGKLQASKLSKRLSDVAFEKVYISPLGRTKETSEILLKGRHVNIEYMEELMEMNMGKWQGLVKEEIEKHYGDERLLFNEDPEKYQSVEGEDFHQLQERVKIALAKIIKQKHSGNVLVVTHGITKKMMVAVMKNRPVSEVWDAPWMEPTALTIVDYKHGIYAFEICGDVSHYDIV